MKLTPSTEQDIPQLTEWISADPYHWDCLNPVWWLTGVEGSLLAFRLDDLTGALCYVRLDVPVDGKVRLHTQFAPIEQVSKMRLVKGMLYCVPIVLDYGKQNQAQVIFESTSELLIKFMQTRFGFESAGGNDYIAAGRVD